MGRRTSLGVQDADQAPERGDYYESVLREFHQNPELGMVSGFLYERQRGLWECRQGNSKDSISGGTAMFRRAAFEQMGGYTPLFYGGSDSLAQFEVERVGWEILVRPDLHIFHYRPTSSAGGICRGLFRAGLEAGSLGYHPLFQLARCIRRLPYRPLVMGSLLQFFGYIWWKICHRKPLVNTETVAFIRKRQMAKIGRWAWRSASR